MNYCDAATQQAFSEVSLGEESSLESELESAQSFDGCRVLSFDKSSYFAINACGISGTSDGKKLSFCSLGWLLHFVFVC